MGGTVGDIESMVFLEALRQFQFLAGRETMVFVHVLCWGEQLEITLFPALPQFRSRVPEQLSKAGNMWREYDLGKRKEIAWIYSPKRRPAMPVLICVSV